MWCCLGSGLSCTTKKYINYYYLLTRIHCWKYFVWPLLKGAGGAKSKLYVISCCRSVRLEIIKVILSNADATTCVCGFQYNTLHGCYNISPPNIDNKNVNPLPPAIDQQSSKHWFLACSMSCFFLFWRCVCPLQCVIVYYLNVSGLQSDRHSNKKENMFWTSCFCPWLCCLESIFHDNLWTCVRCLENKKTRCTRRAQRHMADRSGIKTQIEVVGTKDGAKE